jgi:Sec-independent protein translocase protein TatA
LLVGYFILGPSDLYKLVKEVGKFLQNIRTFSNDLSTTFESSMENSLQLAEIRKAQRELNDAFSFRRSINVDENSEAFSVEAGSAQAAEAAAASASVTPGAAAVTGKTPKKIRRRVRRKAPTPSAMAEDETLGTVPMDLEMPQPSTSVTTAATLTTRTTAASESSFTEQELAEIEREFNQYVESPLLSSSPTTTTTTADNSDSDALMTTNVLTPEQNRFQQQLSGQWNEQILSSSSSSTANATTSTLLSNALTPEDEPWFMETIRKQMALLEQEKQNRLRILEEEYERKKDIEQEFYWKQRSILEEAVQSVASTTTTVAPGSDTNNKNAPVTATVAAATKTTTSESQSQ